MKTVKNIFFALGLLLMSLTSIFSQSTICKIDSFFIPKTTFDKTRFYSGLGIGAVIYTGGSYYLYNSWYKNEGVGAFHLFNDWGEWQHMDKIGHVYTAFNQSSLMYDAARWAGLNNKKSLLFGITMGMLFQTTIEVMDGFSKKWGFSMSDMAANVVGTSIFYIEQKYWKEQKIRFKVSSYKRAYSDNPIYSFDKKSQTSLRIIADDIFGATFSQRYLKDYNAQTYWLSFNLKSLLNIDKVPPWLNIAIGYGGENMFGGFENIWKDDDGNIFTAFEKKRYKQFIIAPDIDLSRIKVSSYFLKSIFKGLNIFKLPTPAIEFNTKGEIIFHLIYL